MGYYVESGSSTLVQTQLVASEQMLGFSVLGHSI